MTATDTDLGIMLAACRDHPDDRTRHLVLADYLDEHDDGVRAEFIRVSCELANWCPYIPPKQETVSFADINEYQTTTTKPVSQLKHERRHAELLIRQPQLLAANGPAWRASAKCGRCDGTGVVELSNPEVDKKYRTRGGWPITECPVCFAGDIGGLKRKFAYPTASALRAAELGGHNTSTQEEPVRLGWHLGLPRVVTVPSLADCGHEEQVTCPECKGNHWSRQTNVPCRPCRGSGTVPQWVPSPWLVSVARWHLSVAEVVPVDRVPARRSPEPVAESWGWSRGESSEFPNTPSLIPASLFHEVCKLSPRNSWSTADLARSALGSALMRCGRARAEEEDRAK